MHPSAYRRIGWRYLETLPADIRRPFGIHPAGGYSLGHAWPIEHEQQFDIYVDHIATAGSQNIKNWVEAQLKAQGIE